MIEKKDVPVLRSIDQTEFQKDKSQKLNYQNPMFQCIAAVSNYSENVDYRIPEHWHEDFEYLVVLDGKLNYNVNGQSITLNKGEGIMVNSRRIHANNSPIGEHCLLAYAIIHPSYLCASPYIEQKYVEPVLSAKSFDYLLLLKDTETEFILDEFLGLFEKDSDEAAELEIIEMSYRILRFLYKNYRPALNAASNAPVYAEEFKAMLTYIHDNYSGKITVDEIAAAGNVGKTLCSKLFKKYTSKTPGDYVINYRIAKGMEFLQDSSRSITDIAYSLGFTGASHFTKTFREITGVTPHVYRQK